MGRSKPKCHGKGGHKDSWDPLLIQSPPQITQRPVGIIQRPKAQNAQVPAAPPVIERGVQIDPGNTIYNKHFNNTVRPFSPSANLLPPKPKGEDSLVVHKQSDQAQSRFQVQRLEQESIDQKIKLQKEQQEQERKQKEIERIKREQE